MISCVLVYDIIHIYMKYNLKSYVISYTHEIIHAFIGI